MEENDKSAQYTLIKEKSTVTCNTHISIMAAQY